MVQKGRGGEEGREEREDRRSYSTKSNLYSFYFQIYAYSHLPLIMSADKTVNNATPTPNTLYHYS